MALTYVPLDELVSRHKKLEADIDETTKSLGVLVEKLGRLGKEAALIEAEVKSRD